MEKWKNLLETAKSNVGFLLLCIIIVAGIYVIAYTSEQLIKKKNHIKGKERLKIHRMTIISMLSAIAFVLMMFEIPLGFLPEFYKIDLSELPVIVGAFTLGPVAGVIIEFIKILLHVLIKGTTTAFVGDFANFLVGCAFVVPASIFYTYKKSKRNAILGLIIGTIIMVLAGCVLNAYVLLPKYAEVFHLPIDALVQMGSDVNKGITSLFTFVVLAVAPFNLIKGIIVSVITMLIYKKISHLLKS